MLKTHNLQIQMTVTANGGGDRLVMEADPEATSRLKCVIKCRNPVMVGKQIKFQSDSFFFKPILGHREIVLLTDTRKSPVSRSTGHAIPSLHEDASLTSDPRWGFKFLYLRLIGFRTAQSSIWHVLRIIFEPILGRPSQSNSFFLFSLYIKMERDETYNISNMALLLLFMHFVLKCFSTFSQNTASSSCSRCLSVCSA